MGVMSMERLFKPFIITPTRRFESLGWCYRTKKSSTKGTGREDGKFLSAGCLNEVMDSETGRLQVHLLCSGSWAKTAWQWCDTKSLPVKEAGGRPPIKTQRLWVTFHRAQLLGYDSMPTHYSWRVVCLVCVSQVEGCHCKKYVCVPDNLTVFFFFQTKSLFD